MDRGLSVKNGNCISCFQIHYFSVDQTEQQMKPTLFLHFTFLLLFFLARGQDPKKVDSLLSLYQNESDIEQKVYLLDDLDEIYIYTIPDSAKFYIDEMVKISKEADYKHGILRGEFLLGHYYSTLGQMDTGAEYYRKTLERSIIDDDDTFLATVLKNLSIYESHKGNYPEAIRLMDSSATIQYEWGDFMRYGSAQNVMGKNYFEMGNYPKAMELYQAALKTMDTIEIKTYHKADVFSNIAELHGIQKNYDQAIRFHTMAMDVYEATEDNLYQANTLIEIGKVFESMKNYEKAIENYNLAIEIGNTYDFPTVLVYAYGNLGHTFTEQGKYEQAIIALQKALSLGKENPSEINIAYYLAELGHAYALNDDFSKAFAHLSRAVTLADSVAVGNELQSALHYRALAYENNGQLQKAINDYKRSQMLKDSLFSIEKAKQIDELQTI